MELPPVDLGQDDFEGDLRSWLSRNAARMPTSAHVLVYIAKREGCPISLVLSRCLEKEALRARRVIAYSLRHLLNCSYPELGDAMSCGHTASLKRVAAVANDPALREAARASMVAFAVWWARINPPVAPTPPSLDLPHSEQAGARPGSTRIHGASARTRLRRPWPKRDERVRGPARPADGRQP